MISYTYCLLRYVHDPSAGEAVNVGILFYAPTVGFVRFKSTSRTHAFSTLFRGFDRDEFLRFLTRLESAVERFQNTLNHTQTTLFTNEESLNDAATLAQWLLPDNQLSFQFGEARGGIARDVLNTFNGIFERLIANQRPPQKERKRRDSEEVWTVFQSALREHGITRYLSPHTVQVPQFEIPFRHAYKNQRWHAVEPISFDYADAGSIREKALLWYGYGAALKEANDFSKLYLLLGAPADAGQKKDYAGAKSWLSRMANRPQLIEEDEAKDFAVDLASTMRQEGVLPNSPQKHEEVL